MMSLGHAPPPGWEMTRQAFRQGYAGDEHLAEALKGADVVIMPAGVPRKPGMTRDDLFKVRPAADTWRAG
jgi:malate/lactate dehydrogenase